MAHRHRAVESLTQYDVGFDGCVAGDNCSPAAHGDRSIIERCTCERVRVWNVNGAHGEHGHWHPWPACRACGAPAGWPNGNRCRACAAAGK